MDNMLRFAFPAACLLSLCEMCLGLSSSLLHHFSGNKFVLLVWSLVPTQAIPIENKPEREAVRTEG